MLYSQCAGMFCLYTKFHTSACSSVLLSPIRLEANKNFCVVAMLLFYVLYKYCFKKILYNFQLCFSRWCVRLSHIHVVFVVCKVAQLFSKYFSFLHHISFHEFSIFVFIYSLHYVVWELIVLLNPHPANVENMVSP